MYRLCVPRDIKENPTNPILSILSSTFGSYRVACAKWYALACPIKKIGSFSAINTHLKLWTSTSLSNFIQKIVPILLIFIDPKTQRHEVCYAEGTTYEGCKGFAIPRHIHLFDIHASNTPIEMCMNRIWTWGDRWVVTCIDTREIRVAEARTYSVIWASKTISS